MGLGAHLRAASGRPGRRGASHPVDLVERAVVRGVDPARAGALIGETLRAAALCAVRPAAGPGAGQPGFPGADVVGACPGPGCFDAAESAGKARGADVRIPVRGRC